MTLNISMETHEVLLNILPTLITAFASIIAMVTSYKAEKNSTKQSYNNNVGDKCSQMLLCLADIYTTMPPEGRIKGINVMEAKLELERGFSEEYREMYVQLHLAISDLVWFIRHQSIPVDHNRENKRRKHRNKKQSKG